MAKFCTTCKEKLGFLGKYEYEKKDYCWECYKKIPKPANYGKKCSDCAYYGVDANYDGFCKRDHNRFIDGSRSIPACEHYK